jgi:hypothetical protein
MQDLKTKFILETMKIKEPEVFLGVARILKVPLVKDEKDENGHFAPRDFVDIYADVIEAYANADRSRKRELLKVLRKANQEDSTNADRTEDSKASVSNEEM